MPIRVILDLLNEAPALCAISGNEAGHRNDLADPPILSVHAGAAVCGRRVPFAAPLFHLTGFLILHFYPRGSVRINPVDFAQHAGYGELLVRVELRFEGVMCQDGNRGQLYAAQRNHDTVTSVPRGHKFLLLWI